MIVGTRTFMLDTSSLVAMSQLAERRDIELLLQDACGDGWLLILTGHQFVEMLRHENDREAERRLAFLLWLGKQPGLAWLAAGDRWESLGMIPHVTASEVQAVVDGVPQDALREHVLGRLLRVSPPPAHEFSDLAGLRPIFHARMEREREIASIVRSSGPDFGSETIGELRRRGTYPTEVARRRVVAQADALREEIRKTGDRRIGDPASVAQEFLFSAAHDLPDNIAPGENPADAFIRSFGVDPETVPDDMSSNDFAYLAEFQQKIRVAAREVNVDPLDLPRLRREQIPTCHIQHLLRVARVQSGARASGGDLADSYLASMAYYIDLVVADKRTVELMAQVRRRLGFMRIGRVCRLPEIVGLPELLREA
ncbi:MAG: hypothetical protein WD942_11235 [Dehalococcoidia bacterium]